VQFDALFSLYLSVLRDTTKVGKLKTSSAAWREVEAKAAPHSSAKIKWSNHKIYGI